VEVGTTPSGLSSAHLHHPPFSTGRMSFLPPNQQCQSTEGTENKAYGNCLLIMLVHGTMKIVRFVLTYKK